MFSKQLQLFAMLKKDNLMHNFPTIVESWEAVSQLDCMTTMSQKHDDKRRFY